MNNFGPPNNGEMTPEEFDKWKKDLEYNLRKIAEHLGLKPEDVQFFLSTPNGMNNPGQIPGDMFKQMGAPMEDFNNQNDDIDPVTGRPKTKVQKEHERNNDYGKIIRKDDITDLTIKLNTLNSIDEFLKTL